MEKQGFCKYFKASPAIRRCKAPFSEHTIPLDTVGISTIQRLGCTTCRADSSIHQRIGKITKGALCVLLCYFGDP